MRHLLEPRLIDPSAGEPGLVVDVRDERRALLLDLADLRRVAPRTLLRVSHVFVTHTHMDHFAGFDHLLGVGLGRMRRVVMWGGPGFVDQVEHKLRAYTWNVVHRYEVPLTLEVREVRPDGTQGAACFDSRQAFTRRDLPQSRVPASLHTERSAAAPFTLHEEATFRVRACFVDHEMPVLAFALEETATVRIAPQRLAAMGLTTGPWLGALKRAVMNGAPPHTPIAMRWRDRTGEHEQVRTVAELQPLVLDARPGRRIGYVTDLRGTLDNVQALASLLAGVDLLFIESVFLDEDRAHASRKNHLTAAQAGAIARHLGAGSLAPFHFSPRYQGVEARLVAEARAAWRGLDTAGGDSAPPPTSGCPPWQHPGSALPRLHPAGVGPRPA